MPPRFYTNELRAFVNTVQSNIKRPEKINASVLFYKYILKNSHLIVDLDLQICQDMYIKLIQYRDYEEFQELITTFGTFYHKRFQNVMGETEGMYKTIMRYLNRNMERSQDYKHILSEFETFLLKNRWVITSKEKEIKLYILSSQCLDIEQRHHFIKNIFNKSCCKSLNSKGVLCKKLFRGTSWYCGTHRKKYQGLLDHLTDVLSKDIIDNILRFYVL
jgi:hypothetical protein